MKILDRIRLPWPRWLVWAVPASAGLLVIGYQLVCQIALDATRPLGLFWLETVAFGVVGPVVAWFLLRQLARQLTVGQAAAAQTSNLEAHEISQRQTLAALQMENVRLREEAGRAEALSTLIQEMHHRIKNNLQTVADLLSLEMSASPSPAARKSLRDSVTRIKSIAAVHQLLSLEQLRLTDISELARQVCDISLHHLVRPGQRVTAEISGPAIYLPSKQATALALVMNELIANALEHAFNNGRPGHLAISLAQDGAQVTVAISDDGRGLPPGFDLANNRGLGLQIVRTLVEKDLAGTLGLENRPEGGSRATLSFYK